ADVAQVEGLGRAAQRQEPERGACPVVTAYQQRLAVGQPHGAHQVAIDGAGLIRPVSPGRGGYVNLVDVVGVAVARVPVGNARAVGGVRGVAFERLVRGELVTLTRGDVEHHHHRRI